MKSLVLLIRGFLLIFLLISILSIFNRDSDDQELGDLLGFKPSNPDLKKVEKNFTKLGARKDVIYKAILRFFKRSYEKEFRSTGHHLKLKRHHTKKAKFTVEEVVRF